MVKTLSKLDSLISLRDHLLLSCGCFRNSRPHTTGLRLNGEILKICRSASRLHCTLQEHGSKAWANGDRRFKLRRVQPMSQ
ncbi:unnamed protein product [Taenia asiatica]|uniref:Uncharacterized protein n=1 Tax=Taenia asiatica TaxID=60517 RepID=A0A0R3WDL7_TAEAS|nr:unnamed protein product [Taenia asiatica]